MSIRPDRPVRTIMSWPVATVDHEATLTEVVEALAADEIGVVLVLREGRLVGIVSERDVVAHVGAGADLSHLVAGEVMTVELTTAQGDTTILAGARAMAQANVRHLPVLEGNLLAGVVSMRDVIAVLVDAISDEDVVVVPPGTRVIVSGS